jgi:hypothetical protein
VQNIAVINGRPTVWGDALAGLCYQSGLVERIKEFAEGSIEQNNRVWHCEVTRKGEMESHRRSYSMADAKKANLWGKPGPWQAYPDQMLSRRARAFCLRDKFPDVLKGLYAREEFNQIQAEAGEVVGEVLPDTPVEQPRKRSLLPPAQQEQVAEPQMQHEQPAVDMPVQEDAPSEKPAADAAQPAQAHHVVHPSQDGEPKAYAKTPTPPTVNVAEFEVEAREYVDANTPDGLKSYILKQPKNVRDAAMKAAGIDSLLTATPEQIKETAYQAKMKVLSTIAASKAK